MGSEQNGNGIVLKSYKTKDTQAVEKNTDAVKKRKETKKYKTRDGTPMPASSANFLSFVFVTWLSPLIYQIYRTRNQPFPDDALWSCSDEDGCLQNSKRLGTLWEKEVKRHGEEGASFIRVCFKFLQPIYLKMLLSTGCMAACILGGTKLRAPFLETAVYDPSIIKSLFFAYVLPEIVGFLEDQTKPMYYGYIMVATMACLNIIQQACYGYFAVLGAQWGTKIKGAAMYMIYEKILKVQSLKRDTVGVLVNMFMADSLRLFQATSRLYIAGVFITGLLGGIVASVYLIGFWALAGLAIFFFMTIFQMVITKISGRLQRKRLHLTDSRIQKIKQLLSSIRLVKMLAWEDVFVQDIVDVREKEKSKLSHMTFLSTYSTCQIFVAPALASVITLILYIYFGNKLNSGLAFAVVTTFSSMRFAILALPIFGRFMADVKVSCQRIKKLLLREEQRDIFSEVSDNSLALELSSASFQWPTEDTVNVAFPNAVLESSEDTYSNHPLDEEDLAAYTNAGMEEEETDEYRKTKRKRGRPSLYNTDALTEISFQAKKGSLTGICGKVGSGKSAFISAILGQMKKVSGTIGVNGTVALCPQEPWIFNDTIRENILFGLPYRQKSPLLWGNSSTTATKMVSQYISAGILLTRERYDEAISLTSFRSDLSTFPAGDNTEIGERGITLSGGQRQRLSLARAVYSDRDIYLLDDPLSALDVTVGQQVFQACIKEGLKDKTVILTTHQLQYLQFCDRILLMDNGLVIESGNHEELMSDDSEYANLIESYYENTTTKTEKTEKITVAQLERLASVGDDKDDGKLTTVESMKTGQIGFSMYGQYINSMGGYLIFVFIVLIFFITEATVWGADWWLSAWLKTINDEDVLSVNQTADTSYDNMTDIIIPALPVNLTAESTAVGLGITSLTISVDNPTFMLVYGLTVVTFVILNGIRCYALSRSSVRSSKILHKQMLERVVASPVRFFDETPSGRIVNRFSADTDMLDTFLPMDLCMVFVIVFRMSIAVGSIAVIFPLILTGVIPVIIAMIFAAKLGRTASRQFKRMDNFSRSHLVNHVTATAHGLGCIRVFQKELNFKKRLVEYLDGNSLRYLLFENSVCWIIIRGNFVGVVFGIMANLFVVSFRGDISPEFGALIVSITIQVLTLTGSCIQHVSQYEARLTSMERIIEYIQNLKPEGQITEKQTDPPAGWPKTGDIRFQDVCMSYTPSGKQILNKVSFHVRNGEKIGVVGRTGAGKSTLGSVLFRLVELTSGYVTIDNVDISCLSLRQLRSKLSVIPQEPVLFAGTLRYNLDPSGQASDEEMWKALGQAQLKDKVLELPGHLEYVVENNGENFSVGERQLLCMTRALLRQSNIVLLDEATANVDTDTDFEIQQMVRKAFKDRTVLIIAHRLNTIQHCDKILVMSKGRVREFDSPGNLLNTPNSLYRSMMNDQSSS